VWALLILMTQRMNEVTLFLMIIRQSMLTQPSLEILIPAFTEVLWVTANSSHVMNIDQRSVSTKETTSTSSQCTVVYWIVSIH
jgi:hypothetical protein